MRILRNQEFEAGQPLHTLPNDEDGLKVGLPPAEISDKF